MTTCDSRPAERNSLPVSDNPVLWRETRGRLTADVKWWWAGLALATAVTLAALAWAPFGLAYWDLMYTDAGRIHGLLTVIFLLFLLVQAAVFSAPSCTTEKESSSWPVLLSTTLSGSAILWSKTAGVLLRLLPASLLLVGYVLFFAVVGYVHPLLPLHTILIIVAYVPFAVSIGLWFSMRVRRTTTAVVSSMVTFVALWLIVPVGLELAMDAVVPRSPNASPPWYEWSRTRVIETFSRRALTINPFIWMAKASAGGAAAAQVRNPYDPFWGSNSKTGFGSFTVTLLITSTFVLLVSWVIVRTTIARFNRLSGRPS